MHRLTRTQISTIKFGAYANMFFFSFVSVLYSLKSYAGSSTVILQPEMDTAVQLSADDKARA